MVKLKQQALDKALALKLAGDLLSKSASELSAIAGSNPALVGDWMARWREQSQSETEMFDNVIEELDAAQRLRSCMAAAWSELDTRPHVAV